MRAPAVAQVVDSWLGLTETFIHDMVSSLTRVRPVVIARCLENLDLFPVPETGVLHRRFPRRGTPAWAAAAVRRRVSGGEPHAEAILAREEVRAVHAHYGPVGCSMLDLRRRTRLPLFVSFYGYDASVSSVLQEMAGPYRSLFDLGNAFLSEGPAMSRRLESIGCPSSKIHVQRIGIRIERYPFRARQDPGEAPIVVLMCGRMVPKKGHAAALRAFARARGQAPRLRLRLVGDGPGRGDIESLVRELGLEGSVDLAGALPREALLAEMDRAHLYLQPSQTAPDGDTEGGAPTALIEAQACGLPIVATRHADIPFVVRDRDSALLADEGDVEGLAGHLATLARSPAWWGSMGRAGRAYVEEHHDARTLATRLEILYATVSETGRAGGQAAGR